MSRTQFHTNEERNRRITEMNTLRISYPGQLDAEHQKIFRDLLAEDVFAAWLSGKVSYQDMVAWLVTHTMQEDIEDHDRRQREAVERSQG